MILADLGADVAKIEPLPDGEMSRSWGPTLALPRSIGRRGG
jgi:crotonobetainyl-CoA:carnitine CoA-transferase CaiB-like acyl-CoA transferase